jgi:hypothetical protein
LAAEVIVAAVGPEKAAARMKASGAMPVTPMALRSPLISPMTAVPWLVSVPAVPTTTPPWLIPRSSWSKRQPHSQSMTLTPAPPPPAKVHA